MWPTVLSLLGFVILAVLIFALFAKDVVIITVNAAIIYFVLLKAYADIIKRDMWKEYLIALVLGAISAAILRNIVPLWMITQIVLYTAVIVLIWAYVLKNFPKKGR